MESGLGKMTTLIDDGLVESCLDDPDSGVDFNQFTVIDVDDIDAIIEDPGCILDEVPKRFNRHEEYSSSYKKRSFALPGTFFDISRNIRLLKKCRPISIKIVDCDVYPWYYKRKKHIVKNNSDTSNVIEDSNLCKDYGITEITDPTYCDTRVKDPAQINRYSVQKAVILKLKEEIDNQTFVKTHSNNIVYGTDKKATLKDQQNVSLSNKNTTEYRFDKSVEPKGLLTYKEIAQTIVRNIDYNELNNKTDNRNFTQSPIINAIKEKIEKFERKKIEQKKADRGSISTSPILPYSVRRQKKTKPKDERMLQKSTNVNNTLEKCSDSHKIWSSTNQIIPHYHCKTPFLENNINNYYFPNIVANQVYFEEPIANCSSLYWHQPNYERGVICSSSDSTPVDNCQHRLVTSTSMVEQQVSFNNVCNDPFVNSSFVTKDRFTENMNPNIPVLLPNQQLHYPSLLHYQNAFYAASEYSTPSNGKSCNSLRLVRRPKAKQVSSKNCKFDSCITNPTCLLNNYVDYSSTQFSSQRKVGNMVQSNPLLTQLLNDNNQGDYYSSALKQYGTFDPRLVVGQTPYPLMEQNIWLPSTLSLPPPPPPPPLPPPPPPPPQAPPPPPPPTPPPPPPQLPPPPPPHCDYHVPLTQFAPDKYFQYPNAHVQFRSFPNNEDTTNSYQHKPNTALENLSNVKDASMDLPNVTISMPPKDNSEKVSVSRSEVQSINQVSAETYGVTDQRATNRMNTNLNHQNIVKDTTGLAKTADTKISGQTYCKINGYSPPILPIPSFKKSLELLSELQQPRVNLEKKYHTNVNLGDRSEQQKSQELRNLTGKRKLRNDEMVYIGAKKSFLARIQNKKVE